MAGIVNNAYFPTMQSTQVLSVSTHNVVGMESKQ